MGVGTRESELTSIPVIAIGNYTGARKRRFELWKVSWSLVQLASDVPPDINIYLARQILVKTGIQSALIRLLICHSAH